MKNLKKISKQELILQQAPCCAAGDIVLLNLDPTLGSEMRKSRPCLILEAGLSPLSLVIVLPITEAAGKLGVQLFVPIVDLKQGGLSKPSVIDCYQIRTVTTQRICKILGKVNEFVLFEVKKRLALVLEINEEHLV